MPEEMENVVEKTADDVQEAAREAKESWLRWCAVLSALFAVLAAISSASSGYYANKAMVEQIQASDQWGYYQAKGVKGLIVASERDMLQQMHIFPSPTLDKNIAKYKAEQADIKVEAQALVHASKGHLERHEILARAVSLFQVAIALIAIVLLTRRRRFLVAAAGLGLAGLFFLALGFAS